LVAAILGREDYRVPGAARLFIAAGLVCFVLAAVLGSAGCSGSPATDVLCCDTRALDIERVVGKPADAAQRVISAGPIPELAAIGFLASGVVVVVLIEG
jgi:hypothetical protein